MNQSDKTSKRKAFSYIRMSTETQLKGNSLERQLTLTRGYAEEKGFELVENLQDIGLSAYSGKNIKAGKLGIFLEALKNGEIDSDSVLLVESLDRLSRLNPYDAFSQFTQIMGYGLEVHTIFDRQIYSKDSVGANPGQLFMSLGVMLRAHSESEDKSKRLKKAWHNKRENLDRRILTTKAPAWLKPTADKARFEIIPERAKTIEKIFELYIDHGMGAYSIASYLNQNNSKHPRFTQPRIRNRRADGKHVTGWQKSYVIKILNNPAVHGEFHPHIMQDGKREPSDFVYPNYYPVIISKERFLLARSRARQRDVAGGGRKGTAFRNIFTKLIVCGRCQGSVHFLNKGKPPKGGQYLHCYNALSDHNCTCGAWRFEDFERSFFKFVSELELAEIFKVGTDTSRKKKINLEIESLEESIKEKNKKLENLLDADFSEEVRKRTVPKLERLATELTELEMNLKQRQIELSTINDRLQPKSNEELKEILAELKSATGPAQIANIRRKLHAEISRIIDRIVIFNWSGPFYPWDAFGLLPARAKRVLESEGISNEEEITNMFDNPYGRLLFDEMTRHFVVHFKNRELRHVHPYASKSWTEGKDLLEVFIANSSKREAEQNLSARKKLLKVKSKKGA